MQVGPSARFSRTSTAAANERALARSIDICSCARCLNVTHQTNTRIGNKQRDATVMSVAIVPIGRYEKMNIYCER